MVFSDSLVDEGVRPPAWLVAVLFLICLLGLGCASVRLRMWLCDRLRLKIFRGWGGRKAVYRLYRGDRVFSGLIGLQKSAENDAYSHDSAWELIVFHHVFLHVFSIVFFWWVCGGLCWGLFVFG